MTATAPDADRSQAQHAARQMWRAAAPGWDAHAEYVDSRGRAVTDAMLRATVPRAGERVLELACGPGGVGLAAAARVGPDGVVVLSDVAPEMLEIAAARVGASGAANVSLRELDLERIDERDGTFDVVLCRDGLMLVTDPAQAVSECVRVLRPDGRLAVAVWGPRARNPWLGALFDAVTAVTGLPVPPPGVPGPFSLDDTATVEQLLISGGLRDVVVTEVRVPLELGSFDDWWNVVPLLAGPLASVIAALPTEVVDSIRATARERVSRFQDTAGLTVPGVNLVASGRRR